MEMPGPAAPHGRRAAMYAALGIFAACGLVSSLWMQQHREHQSQLLALPGGGGARQEDRVYGRIEKMNHKLRTENMRLHKLLQADENADIHVETKLQRDDAHKSERLRKEMQREERVRAELDTVLGKGGQGGESDVMSSGEEAMGHRVKEQSEVESLLDSAKAEADRKLGLSDKADVDQVFAADVDEALGPQKQFSEAEDDAERPGGAEGKRARMSARQRRHLRRHERSEYDDQMRTAEVNLRHGHPHRSRRALRRAFKDHEEEEKLRGFVGQAVGKKPEAWKLLHSTITDDLADHVEAERVEDNMRAVVQLHRDVESAQHQYEDSKQIAAKGGPKTGRMAFMLDVPTRDGGFQAEKVITHKMEGELNKQERAWDRADALESAKAAAARELHLAEEGTHKPKPSSKLHLVGAAPMHKVHFIPKHPFGMMPSTKAAKQQLAAAPAPAAMIQREDSQGHPLPSPAALMRGASAVQSVSRGSVGGAYGPEAGGPAPMAAPRPCEDCYNGHAPGHHCQACPHQAGVAARSPAPKPTTVPHAMLRNLKVQHAPSSTLNGQDLGIKSKWRAVKRVNKSRRYHGPAKDLPKEPREVSNDIVERLLKLAHAGKLTAPEDVAKVEHPISDAISSHESDNRRVDKQEASYLEKKPAKSARHHQTFKGPKGGAFPSSDAVSKLETSDMHTKILAHVENRAFAREEQRQEVRKQKVFAARQSQKLAVSRVARLDAAQVVKAEEDKAATAAVAQDAAHTKLLRQQASASRAQRRAKKSAAEKARREAMAPKGVWGLIAAPIHALFGDSEVEKASPYLPA